MIGCSSSASVMVNIKFGAGQPSCGQEIANREGKSTQSDGRAEEEEHPGL